MVRKLPLFFAFPLVLLGCESSREVRVVAAPQPTLYREPETLRIREVHTIDTGRIWLVQHGHDGHDRVIFCDEKYVDIGKPLCVRWPGVPEDSVAVPIAPPFR